MAFINYYANQGFKRQIQTICADTLNKRGEDPVFRFWKAWSHDAEGNPNEALREYALAEGKREIAFALNTAMLHSHKRCKLIDQEAVDTLEAKLAVDDKNATEQALVQTALFHWHSGDHAKARTYVQKVAEYADEYVCARTLRGWIDLTCDRHMYVEKSVQFFDAVLADGEDAPGGGAKNNIEAVMGKVAYLELKRSYSEALELLNRTIVQHPNFTPALIQKATILIKSSDWEQAAEIAQRVLTKNPSNMEALMLTILYLQVRECRPSVTDSNLNDLVKAIEAHEPRNAELCYRVARTVARLSGNNTTALQKTHALVEKAHKLEPTRSDYLTELGYQYGLLGDDETALKSFKEASQVDEGNVQALIGVIKCQVMMGKLDDAEQQLEFLNEIQASMGKSTELLYLGALLSWRQKGNREDSVKALDATVQQLVEQTKEMVPSFGFYATFNPQFLLEIIREYLQHCPTEPSDPTDPPSPYTEKALKPLELLVKNVPGSIEGQLLFAKAKYISGELETAQHTINNCIRLDPTFAEAHLVAAQIAYQQDNFAAASQSLQQALSLDFEVRDWPQLYNLLKAHVYTSQGDFDEALVVLEHALGLAKASKGGAADKSGARQERINEQDHVSIYLELSQVHLRMKNVTAAQEIIQEAMSEFKRSKEEGRITIANAMVTAKRDVDQALGILAPSAFAKCYEELVEAYPSVSSYMFLGEAYMNIQEPEKAIAAFEKALAMDPNDADLASKIGQALVTTHDYNKAVVYYRNAVASDPNKTFLRHDLAHLYWRLGSYDKAEQTLKEAFNQRKQQVEDVAGTMDKVKSMLLLAKVHKSASDMKSAVDDLIQARVFQNTVLNKIRGEQADIIYQQRNVAAGICFELGEYHNEQRAHEKAMTFYNEALKQDETHDKSMLALAKLYLQKGELEGCEHQCNALLRVDPTNEEATMMLADIMFRKNKYEDAIYHFQQLLEKKPNNYEALTQFVQLLRRAGRLYDCPKFFKLAEKSHKRARIDPGLHYVKGLYHRYCNNPREALREFILGRNPKDGQWSEQCIISMIEVYLNPDNDNIWGDMDEKVDVTENVKTAEKLLKEVTDRNKKALLEAYCLIASKKKENMEKALTKFYEIMTNDRSAPAAATFPNGAEKVNVPCLVGMATALQMMKQTPKARNHLKRVAKAQYNQEEADEFERGWLLLADIYISGGKFDLAQDLLKKALQANKSCGRAWEFMGLIYEKEQSYRDAADCYENAWRLVNESDPGIGYKLAFNYLKAKRYVNAIDVCQKVLTQHTNYPKIRKDILDKARSLLRP
eukprot:CAMPEP_0174315836 /NCGR_PEP_ID=MMETSP0810-20121108/6540_1 /TAXON_ID=73025 ORGANISM="Eutreptiella gymnastica-like, Strain CCMP1594" /NCGR_SAMPLE_ID=MMETSP0810 /ASSEMBLY_ACC=CAM_ASM_000659 /LENGTH=1295 /DNA_ID=CAMNT_0015425331 /DNA_START=10 /DNA_END=3898 /DNA_ORIENTATION=-